MVLSIQINTLAHLEHMVLLPVLLLHLSVLNVLTDTSASFRVRLLNQQKFYKDIMQIISMDNLYQILICVHKLCIVQKELNLPLCVQMVNGLLGRDLLLILIAYLVNVVNGAIFILYHSKLHL